MNAITASRDHEARASTAHVAKTVAKMLTDVKVYAEAALRCELAGGTYHDEVGGLVDAIADAIGTAEKVESDLTGI